MNNNEDYPNLKEQVIKEELEKELRFLKQKIKFSTSLQKKIETHEKIDEIKSLLALP